MIIVFKIIAILVASFGALLAILGESRKQGRITRLGIYSICLIFVGFITAIILEVAQWQDNRHEKIQTETMNRITEEWNITGNQPITELKLMLFQRKEETVHNFEEQLNEFQIAFGAWQKSGPIITWLKISSDSENKDPEKRIRLAATNNYREGFFKGPEISLLKKANLFEGKKTIPLPADEIRLFYNNGNKSEGNKQLNKNDDYETGTVIGATAVINGWPYSYSEEYDWTNPEIKTCGLRASIPWANLGLNGVIDTFSDLDKIGAITVSLPGDIDLEMFDRLNLSIFTADTQVFSIDMRKLKFIKDNGMLVSDFSGQELRMLFKKMFFSSGGRSLIRTTIQ